MWFKSSLLIICILVQSCSVNFMNMSDWRRAPAAVADFDGFINQMKRFKIKVLGAEIDANCSKAQLDADFRKLMASVKRDSCSQDNYTIDRQEFNEKACPKRKVEGYFDKVVRQTIAEEKSRKPLTYFQNKLDPQFMAILNESTNFLRALGGYIHNKAYSHGDRANVLAAYVENVLMPMRDIIVIKRSYLPKENDGRALYLGLQPYMTPEFVKGLDTSELGLITQGPNPASTPFYMEITPAPKGVLRLTFSPTDIIRHDVITLLKAPSAKNYVIALKWMTLHMMLSQVYLYNTILGSKADVTIPASCQNHFNGNLPGKFKFSFEDGAGEQFLENILASHGLTYKEDDSSYLDYYIDNVNKDPTKEGYSGLVPFENYKNALKSNEPSAGAALEPQFDDIAHFQSVMQYKLGDAQAMFSMKVNKQNVRLAGHETFQKLLGEFPADDIAEIKLSNGTVKQIYPGKQNLSPYVLELMQQNGFVDYSSLITTKMKQKFVGKRTPIAFPSMYSSPVWRDWSLRLLSDTIYRNRNAPAGSPIATVMANACMIGSRIGPELTRICRGGGSQLGNLSNFLAEFRSGEKYIPTRRLEEAKFREVYPFLGFMWVNMRDKINLLPEAKPFELNFLLDQLSAGNPWARLKFGYMVALDQLEYQRDGILPQYNARNANNNKQVMCKITNVAVQYNALLRAGRVLGLDRTLAYNHAGTFLTAKEKKAVWLGIVDDIQQRNAQLFSVRSTKGTYYNTAESVSYKTLLSEGQALSTGAVISQRAKNEIKAFSTQNDAKLGKFFMQLYGLRDPVQQQKLYEEFSVKNGIDNAFSMKLNFLAVDDGYKKPIYKDLLRQAAGARKNQVLAQLGKFCQMDVNNEDQFKTIFYATTKAQNDLNQMAGLPSVPKKVLTKINEMTSSEWRDMWWGIGSGVAGVAAIVVGGACTALSGGICAPLGGAMAVAGLASLGIQVKLTANELDRKAKADVSEAQIKVMEELGFANSGSSSEVHRSYAWAAFEAISIFPLIGVATRSIALGPKLVYVSAKSMIRQTGKTAFRAAAKSVTQEEEVRAAYWLLGLTSAGRTTGIDAKTLSSATTQIAKIRKLYTAGEISMEQMMARIGAVLAPIKRAKAALARTAKAAVGKVTITQSKATIDRQTAIVMSNYFGDNPKEMLRLIQGYSGERLNKAVRTMAEINAVDRVSNRIPVYSGIKSWYFRMRNETLAKNASKILRIERELTTMGSNPGQLTNYINKNIEDLTDIFIEIPFKKREIPYFVFVQGMPEFNFFKGRRIPLISMMSDGQTLRRVVTARARLVHEAYKAEARSTLKLRTFVQSETTYGAFKAFQLSVGEFANRKVGKEAAAVMTNYRQVEEKLTRKLFVKYSATGPKMEYPAFKNMVMNPKTLKEKATAEAVWESIPADELMGMKEVGEFAHKAVQELAKYSDVDSFERYISALKVLVINRNAAVLEVM